MLEQAENGWYKIAHEGISGFVSGEYLVVHEEGQEQAVALAAEADAEAASTFGRITASSLNVRSGPSTDHEKVGSLAAGRVVELLEESDGWYRIENGYISTEYVTIVDPSQISKGQEIADYALQFVGYPYVYGGSSPKGFDCSGFTSYVYKQFGITINRTASTQLDNGTPVSMSELQPRRPGHVQKIRYRQQAGIPCGNLHRQQPVCPCLHFHGGRHCQRYGLRLLHHRLCGRTPPGLIFSQNY